MIVFIGEKPSKTAFEKGWTWASKRLASATLHDALDAVGIRDGFSFYNLFGDHPDDPETIVGPSMLRLAHVRELQYGATIIAMGQKVSRILITEGIEHRRLRHPAARGAGRARHLYIEHVRDVLAPATT